MRRVTDALTTELLRPLPQWGVEPHAFSVKCSLICIRHQRDGLSDKGELTWHALGCHKGEFRSPGLSNGVSIGIH
jgi:hypothetical protein